MPKPKTKKKKVKTTLTTMFTLPERPARGSETSPEEETKNKVYVHSSLEIFHKGVKKNICNCLGGTVRCLVSRGMLLQ